ncbi:MAG: hypothetical protein R2799_04865 [Crocinitomicaceae bacterium]
MKSKQINEIIEFGLDSIDPNEKVEVSLVDLMLMYKTMEEFNRFFHNSDHYETIEDVHRFIGSVKGGGYSMIHKLYYTTLSKYIPKRIYDQLGEEGDPFEYPATPYYFNKKE